MRYYAKPRTASANEKVDAVPKYAIFGFLPVGLAMGEAINDIRLGALSRRDEMLGFKKMCGASGDRDGAKFFKGEAADALKEYRAACLLLPYYFTNPPGDCPYKIEWDWPVELFDFLDRVLGLAEISTVQRG